MPVQSVRRVAVIVRLIRDTAQSAIHLHRVRINHRRAPVPPTQRARELRLAARRQPRDTNSVNTHGEVNGGRRNSTQSAAAFPRRALTAKN